MFFLNDVITLRPLDMWADKDLALELILHLTCPGCVSISTDDFPFS